MKLTKRVAAIAAAGALTFTGAVAVSVNNSDAASAAGCDSWSSTLRKSSRGAAVKELQIRVAAFVPSGQVMGADGVYGDQTVAAVRGFQKAYGLTADGVAGTKTFSKLRSLTSSDCTPIHFTYREASNNCGKGFTGNSGHKANLRRSLWQAEGLRRKLGDKPLKISSGYRDPACDRQVGGSGSGMHTTGKAIDFVPMGSQTYCSIAKAATRNGYGGIFGPGYQNHDDHVHADWRSGRTWSASKCGV